MINPTTHAITEFPVPNGSSYAHFEGIAVGSDGNLWFTEAGAVPDRIGEINPTTHAITVIATPTGGSEPVGITAGPDGNLWFTEASVGQIGEINPTTHVVDEFTVPYLAPYGNGFIPAGPYEITKGPDGNVWFTDGETNAIGVVTLNQSSSTHFVVTQQPPASLIAGTSFGLTVQAEDSSGNLNSSFNGTVTVALASGPSGATLGGTLTAPRSNGVATFYGLTLNTAASGYKLQVSSNGVDSATTNAITVTPAAASKLAIETQPSATATAGQAFATQPAVEEVDQYGNVETGDNSTVITAELSSGAGPLQGTTTATVSGRRGDLHEPGRQQGRDDRAQFTGGRLHLGDFQLQSWSARRRPQVGDPDGAVSDRHRRVRRSPSSRSSDEEDRYGNLETGDNSTVVTASLESGVGPLQGTTTATVLGGVATFTSLADDRAEIDHAQFTGGGFERRSPSSIVVSPAAASKLVIHTQPSATATAGQAFATQPVIYEEDQFGNLETGDNSTIVTAVAAPPAPGRFRAATVTVSGGVATFTNLTDDTAETIALHSQSGGLSGPISNSITISPAAASKLVIHTEPSATATAGQAFAMQPVIYEEDSTATWKPATTARWSRPSSRPASGTASGNGHRRCVRRRGQVHQLVGQHGRGPGTQVHERVSDTGRLLRHRGEPGGGQQADRGPAAFGHGHGRAALRRASRWSRKRIRMATARAATTAPR